MEYFFITRVVPSIEIPSLNVGFEAITAAFASVVPAITVSVFGKSSFFALFKDIGPIKLPLLIIFGRELCHSVDLKVVGHDFFSKSQPSLMLFEASPQLQSSNIQPLIQSA